MGSNGILHIKIPDPTNKSEMVKVSDPDEMQQVMSDNFKAKFLEVYDTPLAQTPFLELLGYDGLTEVAEQIILGTYVPPPVIHPDIVQLLEHLKMPPEVLQGEPVDTETTSNAFVSFWRSGREKIQSSMSTMHNGHYIASTISPFLTLVLTELASLP